jgi:hypothetical protein
MRGWTLSQEQRDYLKLRPGEESITVRRHHGILVDGGATLKKTLKYFGVTGADHAEGVWGSNMDQPNQVEADLRVVFKMVKLWCVLKPPTLSTISAIEASAKVIAESKEALHNGFNVTYKVNSMDYLSNHSHLIGDGGSLVGAVGGLTTAATPMAFTGYGVPSVMNGLEIDMMVPETNRFYVNLEPPTSGITLGAGFDYYVFIGLEGEGARIVPQAGQTGAAPR